MSNCSSTYSNTAKVVLHDIWFINAGLLSEVGYKRALDSLSPIVSDEQFSGALFLSIDHLIQYFELASINCTKLVNLCIKRHLLFVERMIHVYDTTLIKYIAPEYWNIIYHVFHQFSTTEDCIEKQFCVDAFERICNFLTNRYKYWIKSPEAFAIIKAYRLPYKTRVIYNSFLIPKSDRYLHALTSPEQKLFEKIEHECQCKIMMHPSESDCRHLDSQLLLEVLFDSNKGNFVGFLDCLAYIVKVISPTKFFIKSLRTVVKTDKFYFSILSDLPMKELILIEKSVTTSNLIAPFLPTSASSKQMFDLIVPEVNKYLTPTMEKYLDDNEELGFWKTRLYKGGLKAYKTNTHEFIVNYQCWRIICNDWFDFKTMADKRAKMKQLSNKYSQKDTSQPVSRRDSLESHRSRILSQASFKLNVDKRNSSIKYEKSNSIKFEKRPSTGENVLNKDRIFNQDKPNEERKSNENIAPESTKRSSNENLENIENEEKKDNDNNDDDDDNSTNPNNKSYPLENRYRSLNNSLNYDSVKSLSEKEQDSYLLRSTYNSHWGRKNKKLSYFTDEIESRNFAIPNTIRNLKSSVYSRFSLCNQKHILQYETSLKVKLIFEKLYARKKRLYRTPENTLNHTLRVILRCNTDYSNDDNILKNLNQPNVTIHDLLKKFYNFDLTKGNFYVQEQGRHSYLEKKTIFKRQQEEQERATYLMNRKLVSVEIENNIRKNNEDVQEDEESEQKVENDRDGEFSLDSEETEILEPIAVKDDIIFGQVREISEQISIQFNKEVADVFGTLSEDVMQLFNEKRIKSLGIWSDLIYPSRDLYQRILPFEHNKLVCDSGEAYLRYVHPDQIELVRDSVTNNIYITLKILAINDPRFDSEFPNLLKGKNININFFNELNRMPATLPTFVKTISENFVVTRNDLFRGLCILSYDLYIICGSLYEGYSTVFDHHKAQLYKIIEFVQRPIRDLFDLFEFQSRIEDSQTLFKCRLKNRSQEEIEILLRLSLDLRRFCELVFRETCCSWNRERCIRILYASMYIDGNRKSWDPFFRKDGDRRLKRIETKCHCLITMKLTAHEQSGNQVPFIEMFFDFYRGNYFYSIYMLKKMFSDIPSLVRMTNFRHLVCMQQGELWMIPDLEWLRTKMFHLIAQTPA